MDTLQNTADSFFFNANLAKTLTANLPSPTDRKKVTTWLRKLSNADSDKKELTRRNEFMTHLIKNLQFGELSQPFTSPPPPGPLPEFKQILVGGISSLPGSPTNFQGQIETTSGLWTAGDSNRPLLYKNSPDGGAFLAKQPIPKRGAFCYIAVISKE